MVFKTEKDHRIYNLDPDDPGNDIDRFNQDQEYIANTVRLGDDRIYAVLRKPSEYSEKVGKVTSFLGAVNALDQGEFRDAYDALSGGKKKKSGGIERVAEMLSQEKGEKKEESGGNSQGYVSGFLDSVPDHLVADAIESNTFLGRYTSG